MRKVEWNYRGFCGKVAAVAVLGCMIGVGTARANGWDVIDNVDDAFKVGYFQVVGMSEAGQRRYAAIVSAKAVAQRDLLERFKGVRVHGSTTIQDGMLRNDTIKTHVDGFLKGARPCGQKYHPIERYAEVCMRLYFNGKGGIFDTIYPAFREKKVASLMEYEAPTQPRPTPPPADIHIEKVVMGAASDGVIIEMAGLVFKPAIVNRILNDKGDILFDPSKVINAILVERGTGGFTSQLDKAKGLLASWGSLNPLIVRAVETRKGTDVVISTADATRMFASDQKNSFLSQAKVVFVVN